MTSDVLFGAPERCPVCKRALPFDKTILRTIRIQIGENIRRARVQAGMSQAEVAANFDPPLPRATITRTETGQQGIEIERLIMLGSIIGVEWRDLLDIQDRIPTD